MRQVREEEDALHQHERADKGDYRRGGHGNPPEIPRPVPPPAHGQEGEQNHKKLPKIDAEIKSEQRHEELVPGKLQRLQPGGKAQPVDQSKKEDDRQPEGAEPGPKDIFHRDEGR